ncbi:type I secretion system permease/ATPase [Alsobacter soli]|nr:type I secretion system permease/ATPase [Alsobacter soli]
MDGTGASELGACIKACRRAFCAVGLFTALINVLSLTGSLFMLAVYDYAIPSQSGPTLAGLLVFAATMYAFHGALEAIRTRVVSRIGASVAQTLSGRVFRLAVASPLKNARRDAVQPVRELESIRAFLTGAAPAALLDLPWAPLYLVVCFLFHPLIGFAALGGAVLMMGLTFCSEVLTRAPQRDLVGLSSARQRALEGGVRNAEALASMGMTSAAASRWRTVDDAHLARSVRLSDVAGGLGALAKVARMALQSAVLAIGAALVIRQEASGGVMIASSILSARALAPVDAAIANWKSFVQGRQSWRRLSELLKAEPEDSGAIAFATPSSSLQAQDLVLAPPAGGRPVVQGVSFVLSAGSAVGVIGPSGSGKSSLARGLVGLWRPARGSVRLDGVSLDQWAPDALGRHVGYLPQGVELLEGSVYDNIARLDPKARPEDVIDAARKAGAHEMILRLPDGYRTRIGEFGEGLSAGQRQRVALARALYGDPFLVVLDEPNANLDAEGEAALTRAIEDVRARGGLVVVIAHRAEALAAVDKLLVLNNGVACAFGDKSDVLRQTGVATARERRAALAGQGA